MIAAVDPGTHNMGWCVVDEGGGAIRDWRVVDLSPTVKKPTIARLVEGVAAFVATVEPCIEVRIEQQPNQNVATKVLSHVLQALFIARGVPVVRIVSPKTYKASGGALTTYSKRKKDSVDRARAMVAEDAHWAAFYASNRKQDDLADALLLARWA